MKRMIEKWGAFLVDLFRIDQPGRGKQELHQELNALRVGSGETVRDYCIRKMSLVWTVLLAGILLAALSLFVWMGQDRKVADQTLVRPGYGEGDRKETLNVQIDGKEEREIAVTVQERKYTDAEKQELTDRAIRSLETLLPGSNPSLDEVRSDLVLPQSMENGAVQISWTSIPYGVIDENGHLMRSIDEKGELVELQGTLTCGGKETVYTVCAKVFPQSLTEEEQFHQSVLQEVEQADERGRFSETLNLPEQAEGRTLRWLRREENPFFQVLALTAVAAVGVWLEMDSRVHSRAQERRNQMQMDYPDLMWKLAMLLGAGLSIKGAFTRISEQYQRGKRSGRKRRYVYEELTYACLEMQSGVPEAEAYERFGRRCQNAEYIRLGSVLSQNLKKGARGLTELLVTEADAALTDRKNNARKLGEKAGTRLLLPMMLMLGIVLAILMVPAFLSF